LLQFESLKKIDESKTQQAEAYDAKYRTKS